MAHFVRFNKSDVVLNKLQCLDGLDEMLLVEILLLVAAVVLLCHFSYKLGQGIAGALLLNFLLLGDLVLDTIAHDQRVPISGFALVTLKTVFEVIGASVLDAVHARRVLLERGRVSALLHWILLLVVVLHTQLFKALVVLEVDVRIVDVSELVVLLLVGEQLELIRLSAGLYVVVVVYKRSWLRVARLGDESFLGLLFFACPRAQLIGLRVLDVARPRGLLLGSVAEVVLVEDCVVAALLDGPQLEVLAGFALASGHLVLAVHIPS